MCVIQSPHEARLFQGDRLDYAACPSLANAGPHRPCSSGRVARSGCGRCGRPSGAGGGSVGTDCRRLQAQLEKGWLMLFAPFPLPPLPHESEGASSCTSIFKNGLVCRNAALSLCFLWIASRRRASLRDVSPESLLKCLTDLEQERVHHQETHMSHIRGSKEGVPCSGRS